VKFQKENTTQDSSSVLFKELHKILCTSKDFPDKRYVFVLKFFNIDSTLYFSFWLQPFFPAIIPSQTNFVYVDTNNLFYLNIINYDIIIIDYPESNGHGLYLNNQENNTKAMLFKKTYEEYISIKGPILSNRRFSYITYMIDDGKLIRVKPIIPPMYKTDKPFDITIYDKDFLEFLTE
jgi:hypothetical protein